jgi:hypothetical protein
MSKRSPTGLSLYAGASPLGVDRAMRGSVAQAVRRFHEVKESAPAVERISVREASVGGARSTGAGRMLVRLITAGWSMNNRLYSATVLREAAQSRAYAKGTKCYVDHATPEEEDAHPSGSVKSLAGALTEDARWDEATQSLVAEVRLFEPWRGPLTDMAEDIGMSIRAWTSGVYGEVGGREGYIVERIESGRSVDFVTVPAAGGAIISVLEAVGNPVAEAANLGAWLESRLHLVLTTYADEMYGDGQLTREERITLSGAIGDGLQAYTARIEADAPQLYQRDRWSEPEVEPPAMAATESTPAEPEATPEQPFEAAPPATPDVTDGAPPPASAPPILEEEPVSGIQTGAPPEQAGTASVPGNGQPPTETTAVESAPTAAQPSGEAFAAAVTAAVEAAMKPMSTQLAEFAARENARDAEGRALRHRQTASEAVTVALRAEEHADVADSIAGRVTTRVVADVPTTAEGAVDDAKLAESITAVIADEATHVRRERANALAEAGVGLAYGVGASTAQESTDDGLEGELEEFFSGSLGLSTEAAKVASKGRG